MKEIINQQRAFFSSGITLKYSTRKEYLVNLKKEIQNSISEIANALYQDLGKSETEAYMTEIGLALDDIRFQIKHLKKNMKKKRVKTPLSQFKGKSYQLASPYGNTLVISPWNYPFLLSIQPLIGAIAAGNTVILKPSEYSPYTSSYLFKMLENVFPKEYVYVALGDASVSTFLLKEKFDYIFFTGGTNIGKIVAESASHTLTPVTLELGGKSPVVIEESANIDLATKRIVFGKFLNCGQTCVAPDFLLVSDHQVEEVTKSLKKWISILFKDALINPQYGKIINERHFHRILSYLENNEIIYGGGYNEATLKVEPTLVYPKSLDMPVMQEEIFGPILPIVVYHSKEELTQILNQYKNPLAFYVFSKDSKFINNITSEFSFGGGCVNDTIIHLATSYLPFGGVGASGMGSYHGRKSFETFSHVKSILHKANWIDLPFRYTPYTKTKDKMIRKFLK